MRTWPCTEGERRYQEFVYDDYGNRVETDDYGNLDASDDEVTAINEFYPDTSAYITNRVARTVTYFGIGTAGAKLADTLVYYDGSGSFNVSPTQGLLTNRSVWLNIGDRYISGCPTGVCVEYDTYGNVTKTINVKGGETTVAYDLTYNMFPETMTNALSHVTTMTWDDICEAPLTVTDPNSQTATTTYDVFCRHDRTDGPLGTFSESVYASFGNPTSQYTEVKTPSPSGVGNHWARTYFDGLGRTYESRSRGVSLDIISGQVTFDARGNVATSTLPRFSGDPQYTTSYGYDVRNRPVLTTLPDLATTSAVYGLQFTLSYDPEGALTATSRDSTGLVSYFTEYLGMTPIVTATTTDIDARTETTVDGVGNAWQTLHDSLGRIVSLSDPDSGVETREYNDSGELTATVNSMGERTELTYDALGRILAKTTLVGTPDEETTTFVYDEARSGYFNVGALTSMLDSAGHRYNDYDELGRPGRVERSIDAVNYVFTHAYNAAGMPTSTTYPDAQTISWTYDVAGNLQTETGTITTGTYDAFGRPTSLSFANGVVTTTAYSPTRGWVENITSATGGITHQDLDYSHYADGMISGITSVKSMETWTYVYDDLNRLLSATNLDTPSLTQTFTYDDVGNITYNSAIGSYTYKTPGTGQPHAVQTAGARSYVYDAAGRMTSRNGQVINWNGDGKPSSVGSTQFTYGGTGERLKKVTGSSVTRYVGGNYEIAPDGTVTKTLVGGKQVGTSFFVHHRDHLGSIQAVTDATGIEARRQDHTPFGDQHYAWGSHAESKGWIGEREEETELVYLNARYYDPEIGRFTAPDPILRNGQRLNRYTYSRNNPVNLIDPTGLDECVASGVSNTSSGTTCKLDQSQIVPLYLPPREVDLAPLFYAPGRERGVNSQEFINMEVAETWRHANAACQAGDSAACDQKSQIEGSLDARIESAADEILTDAEDSNNLDDDQRTLVEDVINRRRESPLFEGNKYRDDGDAATTYMTNDASRAWTTYHIDTATADWDHLKEAVAHEYAHGYDILRDPLRYGDQYEAQNEMLARYVGALTYFAVGAEGAHTVTTKTGVYFFYYSNTLDTGEITRYITDRYGSAIPKE